MNVQFDVTGAEETAKMLHAISTGLMPEIGEGIREDAQEPIEYMLKEYAPEVPTSNYVRTFNYANHQTITVESAGDEVVYSDIQNESYAIFLRGNGEGYEGAYMHVGRWQSLTTIAKNALPELLSKIGARIERFIARITRD